MRTTMKTILGRENVKIPNKEKCLKKKKSINRPLSNKKMGVGGGKRLGDRTSGINRMLKVDRTLGQAKVIHLFLIGPMIFIDWHVLANE